MVFPKTMAPASVRRSTATASVTGLWSRSFGAPQAVTRLAVSIESLTVIGRPWSKPTGSPAASAASAAIACERARSNAVATTMLRRGFSASMRAMASSTSSTALTSPRRCADTH